MKYRIRKGDSYLQMIDEGRGPHAAFRVVPAKAASTFGCDETALGMLRMQYPYAEIEPVEVSERPPIPGRVEIDLDSMAMHGHLKVDGHIVHCMGVDVKLRSGDPNEVTLLLGAHNIQAAVTPDDFRYQTPDGKALYTTGQITAAINAVQQFFAEFGVSQQTTVDTAFSRFLRELGERS